MIKKIYKVLLIILFIFALRIFFANNTYAVEFGVYDSEGNVISNRKNNRMYYRRHNYTNFWGQCCCRISTNYGN